MLHNMWTTKTLIIPSEKWLYLQYLLRKTNLKSYYFMVQQFIVNQGSFQDELKSFVAYYAISW